MAFIFLTVQYPSSKMQMCVPTTMRSRSGRRWHGSYGSRSAGLKHIQSLVDAGVSRFIECGPGGVLADFNRRHSTGIDCF